MKFIVINGPNINMLGIREKNIYGEQSYNDLLRLISEWKNQLDVECDEYQSNHEGDLVDKIQSCYNIYDGIIINPAAYTHTSVAISDALKAVNIPCVEVHISDVSKREDFRQISFVKDVCICTIKGKGIGGYREAMEKLIEYIKQ